MAEIGPENQPKSSASRPKWKFWKNFFKKFKKFRKNAKKRDLGKITKSAYINESWWWIFFEEKFTKNFIKKSKSTNCRLTELLDLLKAHYFGPQAKKQNALAFWLINQNLVFQARKGLAK